MPLKLQHEEVPTLNLTPMIDVLFLLIIFFMAATNFGEPERQIEVAVPTVAASAETTAAPQPLVITVLADGTYALDDRSLDETSLAEALRAARTERGDPSVIIRGDAKCPFQNVATALSACQQAGISELGITVRMAGVGGEAVR